jgi:hypothetical protein
MKQFSYLLVAIAVLIGNSCKKNLNESKPVSSLNIVNAIVGGVSIKIDKNLLDSSKIYNAKNFPIVPGRDIRVYPTIDPASTYYQVSKSQTVNGKLYSVLFCGQSPNVEAIFREENYPAPYTDSSFGVRVINLSPNSSPINITIQSNSSTNLFSNIAYKQISDFVKLPLKTSVTAGSVSFQVRSAVNPSTVMTTYTLPNNANSEYPGISINLQRFKNITIVVKGVQGTTSGADRFGVFPVLTSY